MTVHDLASDWSWMESHVGFRLANVKDKEAVLWEEAAYTEARQYEEWEQPEVRIGRVSTKAGKPISVYRYIDPNTPVNLEKR